MQFLRVIWDTLRLQMKNSFVRPMFRFCLIINPVANTILIYEMFRNSGHDNFGTFVILGAGLMALWGCICFSSAGDINRERWSGTLSMIYTAPAGFQVIILGKILGNTLLSLLTLLISFVTARVLYGAFFYLPSPFLTLFSLFCAVVCFIVFSTLIAYLLTLSRKTTLYMNLIEIPIVLLCGFVIPISFLPPWIHPLSYILPPTWAVRLLRLSIQQTGNAEFFATLAILTLITALYGAASLLLYKVIDKQIRKSATLEVF
ncbi:MAG: ABC transporter permease [Oscillospiraceae bacterium]|nr:ABC transporter permease [Oscillospiraceae bacterium]